MTSITYKLTIASTTYTADNASHLLRLQMKAALQSPVNHCAIALRPGQAVSPAPGDAVTVELGYDRQTTLVFSGIVSQVQWGMDCVQIEAGSQLRALTLARLNRLYEKSTAGEMVKDMAQTYLNLAVSTVESGLKFPVYAIGDRQSADHALRTLARQCGFDLYADTADKLVFAPYKPKQTHKFSYGVNILALELTQQEGAIAGVEVYGESPVSQGQGEQASAWFAQKEVKGTAGKTTATTLRLADPTARTQDLANKIAQARLTALSCPRQGRVTLLGAPAVKLGDGIQISQMPVASHNGTFKVTGVAHSLSDRTGFYTTVTWEES